MQQHYGAEGVCYFNMYAYTQLCACACMRAFLHVYSSCGFSAQRRTDPLPHELLQFKPGDTPKLGIITSIVHLGDTKAQETGHLAVGPEFEPRVGSVETAIVAVVGTAMASSFREQRGQICCMGDLSAVQSQVHSSHWAGGRLWPLCCSVAEPGTQEHCRDSSGATASLLQQTSVYALTNEVMSSVLQRVLKE